MNRKLISIAALLLCLCAFTAKAQNAYTRFDNAVKRILMGGLDTTYIALPSTSWEVVAATNVTGYSNSITNPAAEFNTGTKITSGIGIGYHGLDYIQEWTVNGNTVDNTFAFDFYDNPWGIGIMTSKHRYHEGSVESHSVLLDGYVAFNGSKFSYPAVLYGNYIQKRSAGSALLSFWYLHRCYDPLNAEGAAYLGADEAFGINLGTLTAGYGYNWALDNHKTVIYASACAGITLPYPGPAFVGRAGAMHRFNDHFRAQTYIIYYYTDSLVSAPRLVSDQTWRGQVSIAYLF